MTIYNIEKKEEFLSQYTNTTKDVYERIFKNSYILEDNLGKDIFNFEDESLERFIKEYLKPKTKQSARTYCNVLSSYIQWAIDKRYSKLNTNPLRRRQDYFYNFVDNQNNLYISKSEIDAILFGLVNAQDRFIIKALFSGLQGNQVSELVNLKYKDIVSAINNDNHLELINNKGRKRNLKVDKDLIDEALLANNELEYYRKNGELDYSSRLKEVIALPDSPYILKPTATGRNKSIDKISHYTVYNRLEMIKNLEEFEEYQEALTTKNITRSGMIYEAKKILDGGVQLDKKDIEKICDKFGIEYRWSLLDFLNEDTIKEVYDYEK